MEQISTTEKKSAGTTSPVAFFCAEYAVGGRESSYAGGLGVLAADLVFEAADQGLPFVAIGMRYDGTNPEEDGCELVRDAQGGLLTIEVPIGDVLIPTQVWVKHISPSTKLYFLDPKVALSEDTEKGTGTLYDSHFYTRLKQQILIGIGGFRLLKALAIEPKVYHLNEGNMAFGALALLAEGFSDSGMDEQARVKAVQAKVVSTKHTILEAGLETPMEGLWQFIRKYCEAYGLSKEFIMSLGAHDNDPDMFAATKFLINLSSKVNGVSIIHTVFEKEKHPNSELIPITNGVYRKRWQAPELSQRKMELSNTELWNIKTALRTNLIKQVSILSGTELDPSVCTIVWTRRFVPYKRPFAMFENPSRLAAILNDTKRPVQIVISGAVYTAHSESAKISEKLQAFAADPLFKGKVAFVPGYSIELAKVLVTGADIWLNTPLRGKEACGTSGMKAGLNGALEMSVPDGWIDEVNWKDIGWTLSNDSVSNSLYTYLEKEVAPAFYMRDREGIPLEWVRRMRATIGIIESRYTTERTLKDYREKLYGI
jgi:starch phosphorylase